jgi:hypothetical protein
LTWRIPVLWPGATVAILGGGPSLTPQAANLAARSGPTIAINNSFALAPCDMLYAADAEWWAHTPDALSYAGLKVSVSRVKGVNHIRNAGVVGYSDDPDCVYSYGNSGAQAIQVAAKAGARTVLLYGFDMRPGHWHSGHKAPLVQATPETYIRWLDRFDKLATALKARGVEVLNCSPGSALKSFPFHACAEPAS